MHVQGALDDMKLMEALRINDGQQHVALPMSAMG
jgi:hypothetical protein